MGDRLPTSGTRHWNKPKPPLTRGTGADTFSSNHPFLSAAWRAASVHGFSPASVQPRPPCWLVKALLQDEAGNGYSIKLKGTRNVVHRTL